MAPDPRLAPGGWAEMRAAVAALHAAGIEVILDVVLNHTGEGDELGPTLSLRGLDNASYYRLVRRRARPLCQRHRLRQHAWRSTGRRCVRLAMDALRAWAELGGVDGFRFDLAHDARPRRRRLRSRRAAARARSRRIRCCATCKLIAEPWDIGPGGYRLGAFPAALGRMERPLPRRRARASGAAIRGMLGELATRLAGSADMFGRKRAAVAQRQLRRRA